MVKYRSRCGDFSSLPNKKKVNQTWLINAEMMPSAARALWWNNGNDVCKKNKKNFFTLTLDLDASGNVLPGKLHHARAHSPSLPLIRAYHNLVLGGLDDPIPVFCPKGLGQPAVLLPVYEPEDAEFRRDDSGHHTLERDAGVVAKRPENVDWRDLGSIFCGESNQRKKRIVTVSMNDNKSIITAIFDLRF